MDPEKAQRAIQVEYWAQHKGEVIKLWRDETNGKSGDQELDFTNKIEGSSYVEKLNRIAEIRKNNVSAEKLNVFDNIVVGEMKRAETFGDVIEVLKKRIPEFSSPQSENDTSPEQDTSRTSSIAFLPQEEAFILATIKNNVVAHYESEQSKAAKQHDIQQG